jgi:hypothetical protein
LFKFFSAYLYARPLSSEEVGKIYTTEAIQSRLKYLAKALGCADASLKLPQSVLTNSIDKPLPILARNCLDKDHPNLWYEEVVPYTSIFTFFVLVPEDKERESFFKKLKDCIEGKPVQIGAHASIGRGYCTIEEIPA